MSEHYKYGKLSPLQRVWCTLSRVAALLEIGLVLFCGASEAASGPEAAPAPDLEVKAVFVINFIRLVNWSEIPGEANPAELPVCAWSKSDFFTAVRSMGSGKRVGKRSVVFRIEPVPDVQRCRVFLLDRPHYAAARQALGAVKDAPVLTIGNGAGIIDYGGMFELIVLDNRVQFNVGLEAIDRSGLDISAKLLQLSRNRRRAGRGVD
jgi:hypothetical protein